MAFRPYAVGKRRKIEKHIFFLFMHTKPLWVPRLDFQAMCVSKGRQNDQPGTMED